jgi:predicted aminopeptidase
MAWPTDSLRMSHMHKIGGLLLGILVTCGGCMDPVYFLHVARGELHSLSHAKSIEKLLAGGKLPAEQAHKLKLVLQVRKYARDRLGMNVGRAYTTYEDNAGEAVAYAVSGARRDKLVPYEWKYPIIGAYEAKGFFKRALAEKEAERIAKMGYDVAISEVSGFSTMGILPDPVRASNLEDDDAELAILIFHELTHNTIFKPDDTQFNESMATYVGRTAAGQFFCEMFGKDSTEAVSMKMRLADLAVIDDWVSELYLQLETLYAEPISTEEKISRRSAVFADQRMRYEESYAPRLSEPLRYQTVPGIATDNAGVLAAYRYHSNLGVYAAAQADAGCDLRAMLEVLKKASRRRDSMEYLRTLRSDHPTERTVRP